MNLRLWSADFVGRLEAGLEAFGRDVELLPWIVGAVWAGLTYVGGLDWLGMRWWFAATALVLGSAWAMRWVLPALGAACRRLRWWLLDWKRS